MDPVPVLNYSFLATNGSTSEHGDHSSTLAQDYNYTALSSRFEFTQQIGWVWFHKGCGLTHQG